MSTSAYTELRPAYTRDGSYAITITIEGSGSIAGWTFAVTMGYLDGSAISGATAVIADAAARTVTATLPGQIGGGQYTFSLTATDTTPKTWVVLYGVIEVTPTP